jgi:hypothetical protein
MKGPAYSRHARQGAEIWGHNWEKGNRRANSHRTRVQVPWPPFTGSSALICQARLRTESPPHGRGQVRSSRRGPSPSPTPLPRLPLALRVTSSPRGGRGAQRSAKEALPPADSDLGSPGAEELQFGALPRAKVGGVGWGGTAPRGPTGVGGAHSRAAGGAGL